MATGLGLLRLSPAVFWSMTPKELTAALNGLLGPPDMTPLFTRSDLSTLLQRFPDETYTPSHI
jgi:uncharacterized phage protein (TIGR02216 family)